MESVIEKLKMAKKAYEISDTFFAMILGFGANQLSIYRKGKKPNKSNAAILNIACTPLGMKAYLDKAPKIIRDRRDFKPLYALVSLMCTEIEQKTQAFRDKENQEYISKL